LNLKPLVGYEPRYPSERPSENPTEIRENILEIGTTLGQSHSFDAPSPIRQLLQTDPFKPVQERGRLVTL